MKIWRLSTKMGTFLKNINETIKQLIVKKPYPKNSLEQDATYARKMYCYTSNISGLTKWVKRHMNRRFRREEKDRLRKLKN